MSREIDEIKAKIDIVDLIGGYVKLTKAGANFKALCPFHNEKTPSFMVNADKQIFKCFGCGEGGDVFEFIMKIENLEFPEALKMLAQKAGVVLKNQNSRVESKKGRLYNICELATKYWQKVLQESSQAAKAREYVKSRGLKEETIEDFSLGYAIESWDNLSNFLKSKGYSEQEIFLAGLSVKKEKGVGFYDRFRDRLMFPIWDVTGRVIGFGGRTLKKDENAKYINSPQAPIYNKSLVLYGINLAKQAIKDQNLVVLVEGYMDVIPSHQAGIKNVVSISGTALTDEQVKILKRYSNNLALALDMDEAGQKAAERSIEVALKNEMNIKVVSVPNKDPGECAINSPKEWKKAIAEAQPIMEYFYSRATADKNINDPAKKKEIVNYLLPKLIQNHSLVERDHYLKEFAQRLGISESVMREEIAKTAQKPRPVLVPKEEPGPQPIKLTKDLSIFKRILSLILAFPYYLPEVISNLKVEYIHNPAALELYKSLALFYTKNSDLFVKLNQESEELDLFGAFNDWHKNNQIKLNKDSADLLAETFFVSQSDSLEEAEEQDIKSELDLCVSALKKDFLGVQVDRLKTELAQAEKANDPEKIKDIFNQLSELIAQKSD